jgi:hypothetical protein
VPKINPKPCSEEQKGEMAMEKNRQDLSEAGRAMGPLQEIMRQVKDGKLTAEHLQLLVEGKNPFSKKKDPKMYLAFWPLDCENDYEKGFATNESDWLLPFDRQLPVGSQISFLADSGEGITFRIERYFYEVPENRIFIVVKVDDDIEAQPDTFGHYIRKYWK